MSVNPINSSTTNQNNNLIKKKDLSKSLLKIKNKTTNATSEILKSNDNKFSTISKTSTGYPGAVYKSKKVVEEKSNNLNISNEIFHISNDFPGKTYSYID